ncbi:MAG: enoyl-CoA hydratase-related protein [Pseudomonadota bacterium]
MASIFDSSGFVLKETALKDLEIYQKDKVLLIAMSKFKGDKRAARQAANHLDKDLIRELSQTLEQLSTDDGVSSIILTSVHRMAFCRGAKIEVLLQINAQECHAYVEGAQGLVMAVHQCKKPIVAAISGLTLGGGLELAMACDYRIASDRDNVVMGLPEASMGVIPGMGGTQNLRRLVGNDVAFEMMASARADITAVRAKEIGLVDRVVPYATLIDEALTFCQNGGLKKTFDGHNEKQKVRPADILKEIEDFLKTQKIVVAANGKGAPLSKILLKMIAEKTKNASYQDGLAYEREVFCYLFNTLDCKEGIKAMQEERPAVFKGM